jgi:hypothetical protein
MQQFRPPRSRAQKTASNEELSDVETRHGKGDATRRSPRRKGNQDSKVHVIRYIKGIKMMSEREAQEMTDHGEVLRWSEDSEPDVELLEQDKESGPADQASSEDETQLVVVWERFVIKETEEDAIKRTGEDSEARTDREELDTNGARWTIEARRERASSMAANDESLSSHGSSPCLSEFEAFLTKAQEKSKRV